MSKRRRRETPEHVRRVQELRRSGAASPVRRDPPRSRAKRSEIDRQLRD